MTIFGGASPPFTLYGERPLAFCLETSYLLRHSTCYSLGEVAARGQGGLLRFLAKATIILSEGQNMDMKFESRIDVSEAEYLDMTYKKTGALFQASAEMGGVAGGGDERSIRLLSEYGRNIGIGFQIFDDYLGMTSKDEILGKSVGNDIREGKKTLIVIKTLASPARSQLLKVLGKRTASDSEIAKLLESMRQHGVLDYVYKKAEVYVSQATVAISKLPQSPSREALKELAKYSISRKK